MENDVFAATIGLSVLAGGLPRVEYGGVTLLNLEGLRTR
jgi:hypothetical protein